MVTALEKFLESYMNKIYQAGDELRDTKMPCLTEELFALYENTGNRLIYEEVYFRRRKYLAVFGMLSIVYGRAVDIKKLEEVLLDICQEECWALPPHVDRTNNPLWRITIDLFASETTQALAEIITILGDKLNRSVYETVRKNTFDRVLNPFYSSSAPYGSWEDCEHNWCAVCSGSIGSASIYLYSEEPDKLKEAIARIQKSLTNYLKGFTADGACMEGIGYFTYGMTYFTAFARQAFDYSKGGIDLMDQEKVRKIAEFQQKCYFGEGLTVNFSDGNSHAAYKMGLTSFLAEKYDTVRIPPVELASQYDTDPCFRWAAIYRDYIWTKEYIEAMKLKSVKVQEEALCSQDILPLAQWSILRSPGGAGLAVKGGHNDEPHNHNDVGSFHYVYKKSMLLVDLGAGEYTKEYFGEGRYNILCNSSLGHNVPIINGLGQCQGRKYSCGFFHGDGKGNTILSMENAYEENCIDKLEREISFLTETGTVYICDCFTGNMRTETVKENLVSFFKPDINRNAIRLKGEDAGCIIQVEDKDFSPQIITCVHKDHNGTARDIYLIQWELPLQKKMKSSFRIIPYDVEEPPVV